MKSWMLAALFLPLAGCAGGGADASLEDVAPPAQFDDGTGGISGLVTDDEYAPIAGAEVGLVGQAAFQTATDPFGGFSLSHVPPGSYKIVAQRLGFEPVAREVVVQAGALVEVRFVLTPVGVPVPRTELKLFNGYISCSIAYARSVFTSTCPGTAQATESIHEIMPKGKTWPATFQGVLVEADWKNGDDNLAFDFNDRNIGYYGVYYRTRDQSPLRFLLERCGNYMATNFGRAAMPCTDEQVEASHMHLETYYAGRYQKETHAGDPVCRENLTIPVYPLPGYQAGCYGVGVALELRWSNYVSVFHLAIPEDVEKYSGRPDK